MSNKIVMNCKGNKHSFCLVYQAGIANVFEVEHCSPLAKERGETRLIHQGDFDWASAMAQGAAYAGAKVRTYACNKAGNIREIDWSEDLVNQPFSDKFRVIIGK